MTYKSLLFGLLSCIALFTISCKSDGSVTNKATAAVDAQIQSVKDAFEANPSPKTANDYVKSIMTKAGDTDINEKDRQSLLSEALEVSESHNLMTRQPSILFPLIKNYINDSETPNRIHKLSDLMLKMNKPQVASILRKGIKDNYKSYGQMDAISDSLTNSIGDVNEYVKVLGENIFKDPDKTGINRNASLTYVDACEAYAAVYQNTPFAPENLFKAAEVAKSIRTFPKSLSLYDWIIQKYPEYKKTPTALFLKGFIIENNLGNDVEAKKIYDQFLERYPQHDLADDVVFLIENLGKTDEEILEMIESKRAEKEQ